MANNNGYEFYEQDWYKQHVEDVRKMRYIEERKTKAKINDERPLSEALNKMGAKAKATLCLITLVVVAGAGIAGYNVGKSDANMEQFAEDVSTRYEQIYEEYKAKGYEISPNEIYEIIENEMQQSRNGGRVS